MNVKTILAAVLVTLLVTAPLMAYSLAGLPAAWAYRFINTADAMWGYRTIEFEQLGKFAARLDDLVNWLPARLTAWLLVVSAWLAGEDAGQGHGQHHSANHLPAGYSQGPGLPLGGRRAQSSAPLGRR